MSDQPQPKTALVKNGAATEVLPPAPVVEKAETVKAKPEDPYKPINIKVLNYLKLNGGNYEEAKADDILNGLVATIDRPTDYGNAVKYDFQHFNKFFFSAKKIKTFEKIDDSNKSKYGITTLDNNLLYFFLKPDDLEITVSVWTKNYLVQVQREKPDGKYSEWGTELHTEFAINGVGTIFGSTVDVTYSTRKQSVGMQEGKPFTVKYTNIRESDMGKNLPARIFDDKPESTLMGLAVEVSKLNYNLRNKNFQLEVSLKTNKIDLDTPEQKLAYVTSVKNLQIKTDAEKKAEIAKLDSDHKSALEIAEKVKKNGIEIIPGITIKEINFAVEITDETPTLSI